ncbi:MAG: ribosome assembly factor SBDS [archaeon]
MAEVEARYRVQGKEFQILVDFDKALKYKKGENVSVGEVVLTDEIFYDIKKGLKASNSDLEKTFGSSDIIKVEEKIIKNGSIQVPADHRDKEKEQKLKQIVEFLIKNAVDPRTAMPHTPTRIEDAIKQSGINIDNRPVEEQISKIIEKIREILPVKIETKKLRIKIPAVHTGKIYSLIKEYKEKEDWMGNGDLICVINLPIGMQMDFYDKLNAVTHGSSIVEEIKNDS